MAPSRLIECDRVALGPLEELADGGQGIIYGLPEFQVPSSPGPLVYKEYRAEIGNVSAGGLATLIKFRAGLPPDEQRWLDTVTVWPRLIVVDDGSVRGVVMREIPDTFMQDMPMTRGRSKRKPRTAQFLFVDRTRAERVAVRYPCLRQRLLICGHLAYILAFLHKRDVMFGDISATNVTFTVAPEPGVMLVDCDGVRRIGSAAIIKQLHTPHWIPPEGQSVQSKATDLYKLGLFVLRALSPGAGCSINSDPAVLNGRIDPTGAQLLRLALAAEPASRPGAKAWFTYLESAVARMPQSG